MRLLLILIFVIKSTCVAASVSFDSVRKFPIDEYVEKLEAACHEEDGEHAAELLKLRDNSESWHEVRILYSFEKGRYLKNMSSRECGVALSGVSISGLELYLSITADDELNYWRTKALFERGAAFLWRAHFSNDLYGSDYYKGVEHLLLYLKKEDRVSDEYMSHYAHISYLYQDLAKANQDNWLATDLAEKALSMARKGFARAEGSSGNAWTYDAALALLIKNSPAGELRNGYVRERLDLVSSNRAMFYNADAIMLESHALVGEAEKVFEIYGGLDWSEEDTIMTVCGALFKDELDRFRLDEPEFFTRVYVDCDFR